MTAAEKIAALEAHAASTTFPAEAATARRLAERLRGRADAVWTTELIELDTILEATEWAAAFLGAEPAPAWYCGRTDMWVVPSVAPPLDFRQLVALAAERGFIP